MTLALTVPNICSRHWATPIFALLFTWQCMGMTWQRDKTFYDAIICNWRGKWHIQNDTKIRSRPFLGRRAGTARTLFALTWRGRDWLDLRGQWWWAAIQEVCSGKRPEKDLTINSSRESGTEWQSDILVVPDRLGSWVTGLFWDRTPTAGSHGRFSSRDSASALGEPDFADVSSILSISKGIFQERRGKS